MVFVIKGVKGSKNGQTPKHFVFKSDLYEISFNQNPQKISSSSLEHSISFVVALTIPRYVKVKWDQLPKCLSMILMEFSEEIINMLNVSGTDYR